MKKRIFATLLALVMALGLTATTWAADPVTYLKADGTTETCTEYTTVTSTTTWNAGWYVVSGDVTIDSLTISGRKNVNLILMDGATLTVTGNIQVIGDGSGNGNLYIYGQSAGERAGKLSCTGGMTIQCYRENGSSVTLNSGTVDVGGAVFVDGNGTGNSCSLTVNGGTLNVNGGITIECASTVVDSCASLTVNDGTVSVTNSSGDAISIQSHDTPGTMNINGGTVIAKSTQDGGKAINRDSVYSYENTLGTLNLPTTYWWRIAETGDFTASSTGEYNKESTANYVEITTTAPVVTPPADEPEPEPEPAAPGHEPIRRQNTTVVEDTTDTTDTTKADEAKTDTVTSAKAFDVGVAVYGAMAVASVLGMGYVGKKRV